MSPPLVLDACCILNFASTGHLRDILGTWHGPCWIPRKVSEEAITIRDQVMIYDGFEIIDFDSDEEFELYVSLAGTLGDGEAATLALAFCRHGVPATDDKKARNLWSSKVPDRPIVGTPELLKAWFERMNLEPALLRIALTDVENLASYCPGKGHKLKAWWEAAKLA